MIDLETIIGGVLFVGLRIGGLFIFAPFLGSSSVPMRVKAALAVSMTALLYPAHRTALHLSPSTAWTQIVISEFIIGLLIGLSMNLIFDAVQFAGHILGIQMGFSLVNVFDPQTQADTPVLAAFQQTIALLIFLRLDVHYWMLRAVARSYDYLPAGSAVLRGSLVEMSLHSAASIWTAGLQLAAPALAATMLADLALALIGKASPHLPVLFIGLSIKSMLGTVVLITALAAWPRFFESAFSRAIGGCEATLRLAH